jgi:hypothetical protein
MLYTIRDKVRYVTYYEDKDFRQILNNLSLVANPFNGSLLINSINEIDQVLINYVDSFIVLTHIDKIIINDNDKNITTTFNKFLYKESLIWIDSYYTQLLK